MPWNECSVMDERLPFVARRLAIGTTLFPEAPSRPISAVAMIWR